MFEKIVSNQLKEILESNDILSKYHSDFRKQNSTVTAAFKVLNNIIESVDCKRFRVALFTDLSKACEAVD